MEYGDTCKDFWGDHTAMSVKFKFESRIYGVENDHLKHTQKGQKRLEVSPSWCTEYLEM